MPTAKKKSTLPAKPASLPSEAQRNFNELLENFFSNYHPKEVDEHLWQWLEAGITRDRSIYDDARERSNLLFFYKNLQQLMEAFWLLHTRNQQQQS